ncbi:MAG: MIP/aquaporin family protein [Saprospiraceae bacterium]
MSTYLAEFIGTMLLMILGNGVNAGVTLHSSHAKDAGWVVIALGWGLAVTMCIYAVGSISGAHINPAVTLSLAASGEFPMKDVPFYIIAQILGAITGAAIVWLHYLPHWGKTNDPAHKLGVFATGPAVPSRWANLLSEMIGTFVLIAGLLFIGANKFTEGLNPVVVGALIVAIGMSLGGTTGYAINPARDLPTDRPRITAYQGQRRLQLELCLIPVVGPLLGGVMGAFFYQAIFQGKMGLGFWAISAVTLAVIVLAVMEEGKVKHNYERNFSNRFIKITLAAKEILHYAADRKVFTPTGDLGAGKPRSPGPSARHWVCEKM